MEPTKYYNIFYSYCSNRDLRSCFKIEVVEPYLCKVCETYNFSRDDEALCRAKLAELKEKYVNVNICEMRY